MATVVDICNRALVLLGDRGTVSSIDPPEGSAQADHCARFYPMALKEALTAFPFSFSIKRGTLPRSATQVVGETDKYAFVLPSDCLYLVEAYSQDNRNLPVEYNIEQIGGVRCVISNQPSMWAKYVSGEVNASTFTAYFESALTHRLAAFLAGALMPGSSGISQAQDQLKLYEYEIQKAIGADVIQQRVQHKQVTMLMGDYTGDLTGGAYVYD
jgi:hypothetical protein